MEKLIKQAQQGDEVAIEQLVSHYKGLILSLANKFYLVGGNKDDLLQEGMLGLFYAINGYNSDKGSFPAFAKLCVVRQIVDAVKRDSSLKNKPLSSYVDLQTIEDVVDPFNPLENLLHKEYAQKVQQTISNKMSPLERQVITLFAQGYSYENISEKTGKSFKAVDGALQRARKKLLEVKE